MRKKLHVKKGDNVMVISGDSRGQQGKILFINRSDNRAIVEGVNLISKHTKPNADNPQGGIVKKESPINISNLMVIDAAGNPTRVGRQTDGSKDNSVRYSKKSGEVIK